ncbi:MAG: VCBS repeat-containing protein, partial [Flavobacteriales bacterium]|nr:VCBS repeat-containing protein [Flavobacteriales bacterium]
NGDGTFTNVIFEAGFLPTADANTIGVTTGDIDNDGYREVFVTTQNAGFGINHVPNFLFYNNGDGTFTDITESAGLTEAKWAHSATWFDADLDGDIDLYVGNYIEQNNVILDEFNNPVGFDHDCYANDLYLNNGDLTFTQSMDSLGVSGLGCTLAVACSDYDRDGDADLLEVNDFGEWVEPNQVWRNNYPENSLTNVSQELDLDLQIYGMGVAIGDVDEDLDLDYYFTNIGANALMLQQQGNFEDLSELMAVSDTVSGSGYAVGWGTCFFDFNNDTYLDLFVSNGHISSVNWLANEFYQENKLFQGGDQAAFSDVSATELPSNDLRSRGAAYGDFNNDGSLDFGVM